MATFRGRRKVKEASAPTEWDAGDDESEELPEPTTRGTVRPIHDVDDLQVFRFEIGPAILAQLLEKLERIERQPLAQGLSAKYPGFYQLFVSGAPKYIGKTARPVGQRLKEHARKLRDRQGIPFDEIECRYLFVEDPSLVDVAEGALIDFFTARGLAEWNASGFGSKVTGHGRGGQAASQWALQYPPDFEVAFTIDGPEVMSLPDLVREVKRVAPITIAVPRKHVQKFAEDHDKPVKRGAGARTFLEWIELIESELAPEWTLTKQAESWYIVPRA